MRSSLFSGSISYQTDQMLPSVAPPRLIKTALGHWTFKRIGRLEGIQSPLKRKRRKDARGIAACFVTGLWVTASSRRAANEARRFKEGSDGGESGRPNGQDLYFCSVQERRLSPLRSKGQRDHRQRDQS